MIDALGGSAIAIVDTRERSVELRADEKGTLARFYRWCAERGIVLDVERIYHD